MAGSRARSRNDPQRRDTIIDAALAVITELGVHKTTHRRIATAADVPLGSLTYYFDSLDDLLGQAFVHLVDVKSAQFRRAMESAATPEAAAEAVVDLVCGSAYASPVHTILRRSRFPRSGERVTALAHHRRPPAGRIGEGTISKRDSMSRPIETTSEANRVRTHST